MPETTYVDQYQEFTERTFMEHREFHHKTRVYQSIGEMNGERFRVEVTDSRRTIEVWSDTRKYEWITITAVPRNEHDRLRNPPDFIAERDAMLAEAAFVVFGTLYV